MLNRNHSASNIRGVAVGQCLAPNGAIKALDRGD